jgi:hypothetical protein
MDGVGGPVRKLKLKWFGGRRPALPPSVSIIRETHLHVGRGHPGPVSFGEMWNWGSAVGFDVEIAVGVDVGLADLI